MTARNRKAFERGLALRTEIRDILATHNPLLPPLTAKAIQQRLVYRPVPSIRCVQWHVAAIRLEAHLAMLNSSEDSLRLPQFIE